MRRAELPFEHLAERSRIDHDRLRARRIHRLDVGREDDVDAGGAEQVDIAVEVAWIAFEVLIGAELCRVDEHRRGDEVTVLARGLHQPEMTVVDRAHRRYEGDAPPTRTRIGEALVEIDDRGRDTYGHQRMPAAIRAMESQSASARTRLRSRPCSASRRPEATACSVVARAIDT